MWLLIKQNINNLYLSQSCKLLCDWFLSVALRFLRTKFFLPYYSSIPPLISTDLLVFMIPFYFHLASKTIANSNDMLYIFFLFSIGLVSQTLFGNQSSLIFVRYTHHLSWCFLKSTFDIVHLQSSDRRSFSWDILWNA